MTDKNPADMDTPVIPRPRVLKNRYGYEIADLEKPIATGAFGEIWLAKLRNPLSLLARRIVLGEENPNILELDIPYAEGERMTDGEAIRRVYETAQKCWQDIKTMGIDKGREAYRSFVELIDPVLLENPRIAVKVLKPKKQAQSEEDFKKHLQETQARFKQESNMLKKFAHPHEHRNIIRRYSLVNDPTLGECLLQEYIEGKTLDEHLKAQEGRRMQPKAALDIIVQLADAVNRIHREGIIHRDLKPSNIMLRKEDNTPVIIDFGISRREESNLTMDKIIGTPRYMAPEQMTGQVDARTDVYALATILFEMIAGVAAYPYADHTEIMEKLKQPAHPTRIMQYAHNAHPFLRQLIEAGRRKDIEARLTDEEFYESSKELLTLGKFYQEAPAAASSTVIRKQHARAVRRIKMEFADKETLEQELQVCALSELANVIKKHIDEEDFTKAKEELEKLANELKSLPERNEELEAELAQYMTLHKNGIALRETQLYVAQASEARKSRDYVAYGAALDRAERVIADIPEKSKATLEEVYKDLRKDFDDNYKLHVGSFKPAKEHLDSARAAYDVLEQEYAGKKRIAQRDIDSLLKKADEAEANLKDHKNPDKVGPAYDAALTEAAELRKKANKLSSFGGAMTVLTSVKENYDKLGALYGAGNLVDRKPMDELITQLDSLVKDLPIYEPSRKGALYETAAKYAGELREAIADLRTRVVPKA